MSYIGNVPTTAAFLTDTFSGNGSTTAFTMSIAPATTSSVLVSITGVLQSPDTYSVSGTTLTFSAAPPSGTNNISARYLGIPASGVTTTAYRTVTNFTATAGQTSFSVPSYTVGYIDVYRNGVRLVSTDYTATTGTTVVLNNACTVGDAVVTESFLVSSVLNAIPNSPASVGSSNLSSNLTLGGTTTATTITAPASTALTLQANNGTTGQIISTTGQVTRPNQVACLVRISGNISYSSANTYQKVTFDTVVNQTGSSFNTSTNRFTAPVDGWYLFNSTVYMYPVPFVDMAFYKNGTSFLRYGNVNATTSVNPNGGSFSSMMYLATNDYIELYVQASVTATIYQGSPYTTFFSACLLG